VGRSWSQHSRSGPPPHCQHRYLQLTEHPCTGSVNRGEGPTAIDDGPDLQSHPTRSNSGHRNVLAPPGVSSTEASIRHGSQCPRHDPYHVLAAGRSAFSCRRHRGSVQTFGSIRLAPTDISCLWGEYARKLLRVRRLRQSQACCFGTVRPSRRLRRFESFTGHHVLRGPTVIGCGGRYGASSGPLNSLFLVSEPSVITGRSCF
jgi:hypothetical protein